jgi:hypothetical protein
MKVNYVITSILVLFSIISKVPYYDKHKKNLKWMTSVRYQPFVVKKQQIRKQVHIEEGDMLY